ncbi:hypothetical protein PASE110613_17555 [Paenibacillus sediminis]|uniref:Membrane protein n=1 Tax=Paenibacillus sediminis TaxID=664909 RepID=A0ABS4H7G7_9BACL|nr:hypothetical protein [Paenibacillus sediminis]MBP1938476.1 putative membrane protein [Paenibacillus sediminis]
MRASRSGGFAALMIVLGVLILLGKFTPLFSGLIGIAMALIMIALGYYGIRNGKALIGWIVLIIGVLSLMSKLVWVIVPLLAIGLIIYGFSVLKDNCRQY